MSAPQSMTTADLASMHGTPRLRRIVAFLVLSIVVHMIVLSSMSGLFERVFPAPSIALDVTLTSPQPIPLAQPVQQRESAPPARNVPRDRSAAVPAPQPVLVAPASSAAGEVRASSPSVPEVESKRVVEPRAETPVVREPVAVTPPAYNSPSLSNPPLRYPLAARRNGEQGTVLVRVMVTPEGAPATVTLDKSSGSEVLDRSALEQVKGWRFVPARQGSQAVAGEVRVPVVFRMQDPG